MVFTIFGNKIFVSEFIFIYSSGIVWPSYALKMLEADNTPLGYPITKTDGNLIASMPMLGCLPSILMIGYVNEKIGRKRTQILIALCFTLAWSIIATAKTSTQLIIGRFVFGLAGGMQVVSGYIFILETSQLSLRGTLLPFLGFLYNIGVLASYLEGWFCSYDVVNYLNLSLSVAMVVLVSLLKETPPYLLKNGKEKDALLSLKFYRGTKIVTPEILDELADIRSQQQVTDISSGLSNTNINGEKEKLNQENVQESKQNCHQTPWNLLLTSKPVQRAILLMIVQMILSVFVGMIGIQAYAGQMFHQAAPTISPDLCSVLLAIVMVLAGGVAIGITNMMPRRVLMISSCLLSAASMAILASLLRWSWAPQWIIPLMIVFYCIWFLIGVINVPFIQIGECISPQLQSFGATVGMFSMFFANFLVLLLFEPAVTFIGLDGVFFFFSLMGVVTAIVAYFFMRETKKVPFEIVQDMFAVGFLYRRHKNE